MKIVINKKSIIIGLFIFFMLPIMLLNTESYYYVLSYTKILIGCLGIILLFLSNSLARKELALWSLYCLSFLLPQVRDSVVSVSGIFLSIYPIGLFGLMLYFLKIYPQKIIKVVYFWSRYIIYLYLLFSIIHWAKGETNLPILYNNRNAEQIYFTFAISGIVLNQNIFKRVWDKKDIMLIVIAFCGIIKSNSATGAIACLVGIIALFMYKRLTLLRLLIGYAIVFIVIIVMQMTDIPIISFILRIFEKSNTFTNRKWRWEISLIKIIEHPFLGNTRMGSSASQYANYDVNYFNPHNFLLYTCVMAGIVGLIALISLFILSNKNRYQYFITFFAMSFTTGLMESNLSSTSTSLIVFLAISIYINKKQLVIKRVDDKISECEEIEI